MYLIELKREFINPFKVTGKWYKGNLHTHTTISDGTKTPEEIVELYKEAGYDFLSITDHSIVARTEHLTEEKFLLIPGEEICIGKSNANTFYHIVALGIKKTLPFEDFSYKLNPQKVIDRINSLGGLAILAHPYWSGLDHKDMMKIERYHGVEIYNTSCDFERNTGYSDSHIDGIIVDGRKPFILATDDHHGAEMGNAPLDACVAWINVKANNFSEKDIMKAIREGLFYSSSGPEIKDISIDEKGVISLECSPVRYISFISTPSMGLKYHAIDKPLTGASYPGRPYETYVRIEIEDFEGRKAWSNPIYNIE
jgi:predicted metal-dependent phosphoesterase TrpH